jgi:hypothetical protein
MNFKGLVLMGTLIISAHAHANPFSIDPMQRNGLAEFRSEMVKNSPKTCPLFAGHWKGTCQATGGQSSASELLVYQDACKFLVVNGGFLAIGGTRSEGHVIPDEKGGGDYATSATTNLDWNRTVDAIDFNSQTAVYKTGKGYLYADSFVGRLEIKNSHFVLSMRSAVNGAASVCTYSKQ